MSDLAETADVVVVGGGSAGAVLAARLSQLASRDPGNAPLIDANYLGTGRDARRMLGTQ
jgi:glycine/D-amino acid oxidase-like deaminating enzyme